MISDHAADWTYGHLMRHMILEKTLLARRVFERLLVSGDTFFISDFSEVNLVTPNRLHLATDIR